MFNFRNQLITQKRICYFSRSIIQSHDEFDLFLTKLEILLEHISRYNPFFIIFYCDFNAKSNTWLINDQLKIERSQLEFLTLLYGMKKLIVAPTHILENLSSCINLIFTNKKNLIKESGVNLTLHSNSHHQIMYSKLNLKIEYLPLYAREIQDYNFWSKYS